MYDAAVERGYGVSGSYGSIEGVAADRYARTNIVGIPHREDPEKTTLFATNKDVRDEIGLDRQCVKKTVEEYSKRGEQKKCYKMVKEFPAPTQLMSFRCTRSTSAPLPHVRNVEVGGLPRKEDLGILPVDEEGNTTDTVIEFDEVLGTVFLEEIG